MKRVTADSLTPEKFLKEYVLQSKPVLITNGMQGWPALRKWKNDYLRELIGNETSKVEVSSDNVFRYAEEGHHQMPFSDFLDLFEKQGENTTQHYAIGIQNTEPLMKDLK